LLANGTSVDEVLEDYPGLEREDVLACIAYGSEMTRERYVDVTGRTLTVWFGAPQDEYVCEETGDEVVLMKDKAGHVIGFERLNYPGAAAEPVRVLFESVGAAESAA
jgi:hypothetical protein